MAPTVHVPVIYRPTLHHFGVVTRRLPEMVRSVSCAARTVLAAGGGCSPVDPRPWWWCG